MENLKNWNKEFMKHFHKKFFKFSKEFYVQLLAVAHGMKLSFLFDLFATDQQSVEAFLRGASVMEDFKFLSSLHAFSLNDEIFICDTISVMRVSDGSSYNVIFVDVSKELTRPKILESDLEVILDIKKEFRHILTFVGRSKNRMISLNPERQVSMSSIFGLLLNFPVVYCCKDDGNCLSLKPLINMKVYLKYFNNEYCIYSFTYPKMLEDMCKDSVSLWLDHLRTHVKELNFELKYGSTPCHKDEACNVIIYHVKKLNF
ncbi:hypothetical protein HELRODRAFT_179806 [Helobdella robusta]|uniref:Uncharacterized protein n=1 Tax=Helobdella robusta TaxID=6412 RepID=T1FF62_HELRO|nr:hypothetical protein HELRODRAFT_179806 [Helobdella robusta]ESN94967.1 hypothetical protein HELRODRAFT_179806 [Helobdella robusta]